MGRLKEASVIVDSAVADEVTRMLNSTDKTQLDICTEIGLPKSNIMTMFKQGRTKLPIKYVVPLSLACDQNPEILMGIAMKEYFPEILDAMGQAYGKAVTEEEQLCLNAIRRARSNVEKKKQDLARKKFGNKQGNLVRAAIKTRPEDMRKLHDFARKELIE